MFCFCLTAAPALTALRDRGKMGVRGLEAVGVPYLDELSARALAAREGNDAVAHAPDRSSRRRRVFYPAVHMAASVFP